MAVNTNVSNYNNYSDWRSNSITGSIFDNSCEPQSDSSDVFTIFQWNCRGLSAHKEELKMHLSSIRTKYDIICLQETLLRNVRSDFNIPGYKTIRRDRPDRAGGGLVTLVKDTLNFTELDSSQDIECIYIRVKSKCGYINVANVYLPPNSNFNKDNLSPFFQPKTVVVGDFNAKSKLWGCVYSDNRGRIIEDLLDENNFCCINDGQPTYTHYDGTQSHLDLSLVCSTLAAKSNWAVYDDTMGSDHSPAITRLFDQTPYCEEQSLPHFKFSKADWANFKQHCRANISDIDVDTIDVNTASDCIAAAIVDAAQASIPQSSPSSNRRRHKPLPYWGDGCKKAIKERNRARNAMLKNNTPENVHKYRRLKGVAQYQIKASSRAHWQNYCSTLTSQTKLSRVWTMAKKMNGVVSQRNISNLVCEGNTTETARDKAEVFANTFASISSNSNFSPAFLQRKIEVEQNHSHLFENDHVACDSTKNLNETFSLAELRRAIRESKCNKASGYDNVSYEMLQQLPKIASKSLLKLYNKIWLTGTFPTAWRHAIILPVLKQGKDPKNPTSYRPISLTSTLSKIFEKIVATRLSYHLEKHNILSDVQSGFRPGRSTIDQIMRLQNAINNYNHNKGYTVGVFIDFNNAFDMVWREGLLIKIKKLGLTGNIFSFIKNFLTNRTIQVRVGNEISSSRLLQNGTAQGSVISPLLFLLMINDLPDNLHNVESSLFADDSCIFKSGRNLDVILKAIQDNLNKVSHWCDLWGFKINISKTAVVLFTHRIDKIETTLTVNSEPIKIAKTIKFLGLIFDSKLTWNAHIAYIEEKCKKRLNLMRMISGQNWGASKTSLLIIYRALVRSVLDYGATAYNSTSQTNKQKLDKIQTKALRIACRAFCTSAVAALQVETGEMPLELRRSQQELNYAVKLKVSNHNPAKSILDKSRLVLSKKFSENSKPFYCKTYDFLDTISDVDYETSKPGDIPPWLFKSPNVDKTLQGEVSKKENPEILKHLALERISLYEQSVCIYTDASRLIENRTAAAFYIPELKIKEKYRLSDELAIFSAELTAIKLALTWTYTTDSIPSSKSITIFSDSLSSLQAIDNGKSSCSPNLLNRVLELISKIPNDINFVWIPSHVGIPGNEIADRLARDGAKHEDVDYSVPLEQGDISRLVSAYICEKWQNSWNSNNTGHMYREIEPCVSTKVKFVHNNRKKEIALTRLRIGKCCLNSYLHEINAHPTGLCNTCNEPETVEHYLIYCKNAVTSAVRDLCSKLNVPITLSCVAYSAIRDFSM